MSHRPRILVNVHDREREQLLRRTLDAVADLAQSMTAGFDRLRTEMSAGFASTNARLDQVEADVRDIKGRLAS